MYTLLQFVARHNVRALNEGITGKVILDEFADREPDYWITDMAPNGTFIKVAEVLNVDLKTRVSLRGGPTNF